VIGPKTGLDMIWVRWMAVFFLVLVDKSSSQYKYVFYDGDEAEYTGTQDGDDYEDDNGAEGEYYEEYYEYEDPIQENNQTSSVQGNPEDYKEEEKREGAQKDDYEDQDVNQVEEITDVVMVESANTDNIQHIEDEQKEETQTVHDEYIYSEHDDNQEDSVSETDAEQTESEDVMKNEEANDAEDNYDDYDEEESYTDDQNYEDEYEGEDDEESDYNDEDVDRLYANYEILSEFYQKHFVDLRILDETCDPVSFPGPTIQNGIVRKYERVENVLLPGRMYRQAVYQCNAGYALSSRTSDSMFCQEYGWTGLEPDCERSSSPIVTESNESCGEQSGCSQECKIEDGRAVCYCSVGFLETSSGECEDIDECAKSNGECDEECINKPGSYMCSCPSGFELSEDNHGCLDANECLSNNGHGPCQDTCVNEEGYYYCECGGLPGTKLAEDNHLCKPIDMCAEDSGGCSHECYSSQGQAYCTCPQGLELEQDWKTCKDVDECEIVTTCDGKCVNTFGSYRCLAPDCDEGFLWSEGECKNICSADEIYKDGSCLPKCGDGFQLKDGKCSPRCGSGYKWKNGECAQFCEYGFILKSSECVPVCGDINPCGRGECFPAEDYFECDCEPGFTFQNNQCEDKDECTDRTICKGGECVNTEGSYSCECGAGYRLVGDSCRDIDECEENNPCSQTCTNTPGSFKCSCQEGFLKLPGNKDVCKDIDECNLKPAICEHGCQNSPGGFLCVCNSGFSPNPEDSTKCISTGCPVLNAPEGGVLNCSPGNPVGGSVCRLECQSGFARRGKLKRKCMDDGNWEEGQGWCQKVTCPALSVSSNVQVFPSNCLTVEMSYKQKCKLTCPAGFDFEGSKAAFCGKRNNWVFRNGPTKCIQQTKPEYTQIPPPPPPMKKTTPAPPPYIVCPPDIMLNLTGVSPMLIQIPKPKTNVEWEKHVRSYPDNAKSLSYYQEPGVLEIKFEATSAFSNQMAFCKVVVTVQDAVRPTVSYCPQSRSVFLEPGQTSQRVFWKEPAFTDNVKIEHVIASALPGQELNLGKHLIVYQAADKAGNKEKCVFTITVVQFKQELPGRKWVLCRVGNTGRQIRLLVTSVPRGCRQINIKQKV